MKIAAVPMQIGKRLSSTGFGMLYGSGMLDRILRADHDWLTALSYHRIEDPAREGFDSYTPNVSATPEGFRQQMEYVKARYNAITCERLAEWLRGECDLPPHPAIITFDDGYYDNLQVAYPVLHDLRLPATIFLTTDIIGSSKPFVWDEAAYCFLHTHKTGAELPVTGRTSWSGLQDRQRVLRDWYTRVKNVPETERREIVARLADELDVKIPAEAFTGLYLNWDQVRELSQNGIEMGAHTESHPILTSVPLERAEQEIINSKRRIEAEIGKPVLSFAYPNGRLADFSDPIKEVLRREGIEVAFTLIPGPTRLSSVKRDPLGIRRIFVGYQDTLPRFAAKLAGLTRLAPY